MKDHGEGVTGYVSYLTIYWHAYSKKSNFAIIPLLTCVLANLSSVGIRKEYCRSASLKIVHQWPTTTKIRRTKIFQHRSDEVRLALLGYTKPVRGLSDHRRLLFFFA